MGMASQELHVLAVDDSLVDRKVIEKLLKISCCKVTAVESGRRALQFLGLDGEKSSIGFDALKVNLILTDYSMPGMTGYELLKKIKGSSTLKKIPVVIMSSENILTRIDRCLEEGAEEFLMKPVKLDDVKRIKDSVLKGEGEGEECGKKNSFGTRNEGEENMPKETRKRKNQFDATSSVYQPSSLTPISPFARNPPASNNNSSSQELDSTRSKLINAIDQYKSLSCDASKEAAPKQSNTSKRHRLENAADS